MNADKLNEMPLPTGAVEGGVFLGYPVPSRLVYGPDHKIGEALVYASALQTVDGTVKDPAVRLECFADDALSSDQARMLAAEILNAADEADSWR